ncbi:hypothetical protein VKT23_002548 [Stygiomarasmius scandens]|uniref:Uncharacterized protein n=1 Tax=Marasmiellus scandens TaxID=2682957 RepID=A0ABR1K8D4_9AGAR
MAKPTLLQTLLGRPSQSYSFPKEKDYHSTKAHMRRVAQAAGHAQSGSEPNSTPGTSREQKLMGTMHVINEKPSVVIIHSPSNYSQHPDNDTSPDPVPDDFHQHVEVDDDDSEEHGSGNDDNDSDDDNNDADIFYTPNTTPRSSMASYPTSTRKRVLSDSFDARSTVSSSTTTATSDTYSIFSSDSTPVSDSTRITTPYNSESGHDSEPKPRHPHVSASTSGSTSSRREAVTRANTERAKRNSRSYTDEDWAKDVRWLVSPDDQKPKKKKSTTSSASSTSSFSSTSPAPSYYITPIRTPSPPKTPPKQKRKTINTFNPSIMMSMTALLEEDEDAYIKKNNPRGRTSSTPDASAGADLARSNTAKSTSSRRDSMKRHSTASSSDGQKLVRRRSRSLEDLGRRRSAIVRVEEDDGVSSTTSAFSTSRSALGPYAPSIPSQGTPGYTSLTLPRAPPPAFAQVTTSKKRASILVDTIGIGVGEGKVDLTRSGIAQTTMASVEVVRGLGGLSTKKAFGALFGLGKQKPSSLGGTGEDLTQKLGFTSWRKPPNHVPSNSVLVQVWAVGVDGVDGRLVGLSLCRNTNNGAGLATRSASTGEIPHTGSKKRLGLLSRSVSTSNGGNGIPWHRRGTSFDSVSSGSTVKSASNASGKNKTIKASSKSAKVDPPEVGYIPGRSFVGRVLEVGWEVRDEIVRKGEWVVGLLDVRKCGALQEFIVVDRHKVFRVPHPTLTSSQSLVDPNPNPDQADVDPAQLLTLASLTLNQPQHQPSSLSRYPIPAPYSSSPSISSSSSSPSPAPSRSNSMRRPKPSMHMNLGPPPPPTLQELALLPLCGVPAYRAVRTFQNAFALSPSSTNPNLDPTAAPWLTDHLAENTKRRALVLRGHDGVGAMAVQMLVRRGWRVCVHAPLVVFPSTSARSGSGSGSSEEGVNAEEEEEEKRYMKDIEDRVRRWGAEEVVFDDGVSGSLSLSFLDEDPYGTDSGAEDQGRGAVLRVIERLIRDGDVFDAVLDTVGGKEVWEASERLLRNIDSGLGVGTLPSAEGVRGLVGKEKESKKGLGRIGSIRKKERDREKEKSKEEKRKSRLFDQKPDKGPGQFTTLFGDTPSRVIPTAGDHFRASLRSMKNNHKEGDEDSGSASTTKKAKGKNKQKTSGGPKVGYAWVSIAQDVDWDGEDVRETIGEVMKMALNEGVRPWVGDSSGASRRVVPFERTPEAFVEGGPLGDGGSVVVRVVE